MARDERHPVRDRWLEEGLERLGQIPSQPGLESRILANLRAEKRRVALGFWQRWGLQAAALTSLALLIVWRSETKAPVIQRAANSPQLASANALSVPVVGAVQQVKPSSSRKKITPAMASHSEPQQFPSPRPLSSQEELLLAFVNQTPAEEVLATAHAARRDGNLEVQSMEIAPLDIDQPESSAKDR